MTKHKSKTSDALDKLRTKRSAAIKALAKANAALDTLLKYRDSPHFPVKFEELAAAALEGHEYNLAIALNNLCYLDEEVAGEYGSVQTIERTQAKKRAAPEKAAKVKAR